MSQAHVLCPSCNSEYPLPSGVQVNTATQCPKCGKTGVPMFLHEQTSSSSAAVLLVLAMLGGFLTLGVGIVVMVLIWLPSSMETPAPQERVLSRTVEQPPKTLEVETAPGAPLPERRVSPLPRIEPKKSTKALHKRDPALGELQYGWNQGQSRQYTFRIEAKTGDNKLRSSGSVIYTVTSTPEEMADSIPREEGSGSAFVVSANGHLVTLCTRC